MRKPFSIFVLRDQSVDVSDLAKRIAARRLARRQAAAEQDPGILADHQMALQFWRAQKAAQTPPDEADHDFFDMLHDGIQPKLEDHPRFPRNIPPPERLKISSWLADRAQKRRGAVGHPLPAKITQPERDEITAAAEQMHAVFLSEHEIDVAFAGVHKDFPWLARLTEKAWHQARRRARAGLPAGVGALLVQGPPGLGKSSWARAVAGALALPTVQIDAGVTGGVFEIQGLARGWGSAERGRVVSTIIAEKTANPLIVIDEIDAGGSSIGVKVGTLPGLHKIMMSMIEPSTAQAWPCPYYQLPFDLRNMSVVATCNNKAGIEQALLDRMTIVELPDLTPEQIIAFTRVRAGAQLGEEMAEAAVEAVQVRLRRGQRLSLRHVVRLIDSVEDAMQRPLLH